MAVTDTNASITIANESCLNACLGVGGGVSVVFCDMSNNNNVTFQKSFKLHRNAVVLGGGGMFIGHFDNSFRNTVILGDKLMFSDNQDNVVIGVLVYNVSDAEHYFKNLYRFKLCGGGLLVYHCDQSHSSKLNMTSVMLINNTAEAGGGMCAIYKDSSNRHQMSQSSLISVYSILQNSRMIYKRNVKYKGHGGGMLAIFQSSSSMNKITSYVVYPINNTAFTSGGGLFAGFYEKAFNNTIYFESISCKNNTAKHTMNVTARMVDGRGGGYSIVFADEASHNMFSGLGLVIYENSASRGGGVHVRFANWARRNRVHIKSALIYDNVLLHQKATGTAQQGGGGGVQIEFFTYRKH